MMVTWSSPEAQMDGKDGSADPLIIGFQKFQSPDATPAPTNPSASRSYGAMQPQHLDPYPTAFDNPRGKIFGFR